MPWGEVMSEEIILADRTLEVLKNFAALNPGLVVEGGNIIRTVLERTKTVQARVTVPQSFPVPFALYDIRRFLAAVSVFTAPKVIFNRGTVTIEETEGEKLRLTYPLTTPDCVEHPKRDPKIDPTFAFPMPRDRFKLFARLGAALNLPHVTLIAGEDRKIYLGAVDAVMPGKAQLGGQVLVAENAPRAFRLVWAAEDWAKMLPGDYQVGIELQKDGAIAQFVGSGGEVNYWIPTRVTDDQRFGARK
jgi:hypothetical protein